MKEGELVIHKKKGMGKISKIECDTRIIKVKFDKGKELSFSYDKFWDLFIKFDVKEVHFEGRNSI